MLLRPIFQLSPMRCAYAAMSSGWVVGTISTTTCAPRDCSKAVSLASSAAFCAAVRVPVLSITCAVSGGTGCTPCAQAATLAKGSQTASNSACKKKRDSHAAALTLISC